MRISLLCSVASLLLASTAALAQGEGEFPATLAGHAVLPAQSFIDAPADAPDDLKTSGKYTTGRRVDASATTTTCRSPRAAIPTRPTTMNSCCSRSGIF
jgi:hypothetical protein